MPINSKAKGSGFELKVAKRFTEWSGYKFHRTPASGALHWANDKRVISDIVPPQELLNWPLSIECKNVTYDWNFSAIIKGTSMFWEHWKQACDDANREELIPVLVFTKNYQDTYIGIPVDAFVKLFYKKEKPNYITIHSKKDGVIPEISIVNFDDFLSCVSLQEVLMLR